MIPTENQKTRRLSAIMFTDIVGYSAMMQQDEKLSAEIRVQHRQEFEPYHEIFNGEILQYYGDGTLSVFQSGVQAVECAIAIQKALNKGKEVPLRIGLHMGDVVFDGTEIYGDGVNVASRIENIGVAGTVLLSAKLNDELKNHVEISTASLGYFELKNIENPVEVFSVTNDGIKIPDLSELQGKAKSADKSIAVLPFVNMSSNEETEYFSDGMTEEIINALSKIKKLKVTSRTSSFFFKNKQIPIPQIGKELNVSTVLEGSIRLSGNMMRITAQLINVGDDFHFWSETWDRKLENVFEIQDEVSLEIAEKLREDVGHFEIQDQLVKQKTSSVEAYENYLKGTFHYLKWNQQNVELAIEYFEKAISLDSNYVEAYCALSGSYIFLASTGYLPAEEAFKKSKKYADTALKLNDRHLDVNFVLGGISLWHDWDFAKSLDYINRVLDINPSHAEAHHSISVAYMITGRKNLALKHIEIAINLDPFSLNYKFMESWIRYIADDISVALELTENILLKDPDSHTARIINGCCLILENRGNEVIEYYEERADAQIDISTKLGMLALAYVFNKDQKKVEKYLKLLNDQLNTNHAERSLAFIFLVHAASGESDKALDWLEKGLKHKAPSLLFLIEDPLVNPIKTEQKYKDILNNVIGNRQTLIEEEDKNIRVKKAKKPLLDTALREKYIQKVLSSINIESSYLDPNLTLRSLAEQIEVHPNHLTWLLNEELGKNFNDFINHYRVDEFKRLVMDSKNAHITLIGLAFQSGFNSKTTFNTYFKKEMGMSPKEWMKSAK